jgi:hypothetical protein
MLHKLVSLMLILVTGGALAVGSVFGNPNERPDKAAAKIKQRIIRFGESAPVIVTLGDNSKLNGRIGEIDQNSFVLREGANGEEQLISYSAVQKVTYVGSAGGANLGPAFLVFIAVVVVTRLLR